MSQITVAGQPTPAEVEFQQKMMERMRQAFGDLMPDAVLSGIVARGIEEAFFKKRVKPKYNSWERDEEMPSWLVAFLETEARKHVEAAVRKWAADNDARIKEMAEKAVERGIASAVVRAFDSLFLQPMNQLRDSVADVLNRLRDGG